MTWGSIPFWDISGENQGIPGNSGNSRNRFPEFGSTGKVHGKYREFQGKYRGFWNIPGKVSGKDQGISGNPGDSGKSIRDFRETFRGFQGEVQGNSGNFRDMYREFQGIPGNSLNSLNRRCLFSM